MRLVALCSVAVCISGLANSADGPTFDAASVKLAGSQSKGGLMTGGPGTNDPARFRAPRIDLFGLLPVAFGMSADQIAGPAWLRDVGSNSYTIDATMPPDTTKEQFLAMLQNLLVERFHLVFHREKRSFPGYALVVDRDGPRFKEVPPTPDANPGAASGLLSARRGSDGFPDGPGPLTMTIMSGGGLKRTKYQERTMADFISNLGLLIGSSQAKSVRDGFLQPRVVDKTGLTGKYTFILEYYDASHTPEGVPLFAPGAFSAAASDADGGGPSIFAAIQKQLGLRLDKTADIPLDVIVVESVEKVPTAN
jgi:uncharacterized protein (TIGR03435 family)